MDALLSGRGGSLALLRARDAGRLEAYDANFGITAELPVSQWEGHEPEGLTSDQFEEVWDTACRQITARRCDS